MTPGEAGMGSTLTEALTLISLNDCAVAGARVGGDAPHGPRVQASKPILKQGHDNALGGDDSRRTLRRVRNASVSRVARM